MHTSLSPLGLMEFCFHTQLAESLGMLVVTPIMHQSKANQKKYLVSGIPTDPLF